VNKNKLPVPPAAVTVITPSEALLQETWAEPIAEADNKAGFAITTGEPAEANNLLHH